MITGAILEKGEIGYTYLKKIFQLNDNFQENYNWLITDCEAYPKRLGHSIRISQSTHGDYAWITGEELTNIVQRDDFQWIWAVLSGFDKQYSKDEILKYDLPYADGYGGFWKDEISLQHPLASVELVAWDSSCTLLISKYASIVNSFRNAFPLSKDLMKYNIWQKEKGMILSLLKNDYDNKNFTNHYLLPYQDFLDTKETFTDFHCERGDGKAQYVSLIEQLIHKDENAKIFVQIYGFEEETLDTWIYADTLILFSQLPVYEIKQLFHSSNDVFPSDIGEVTDFSEKYILIKDGIQTPANELFDKSCTVYYCWWD